MSKAPKTTAMPMAKMTTAMPMAKMTTRAAKGMGKGDKSGAGASKGKGNKKGKKGAAADAGAENKMSGSGSGMAAGLMAEGGVKTTHIAAAGGSMFALAGVLIVVGLALKSRNEANAEVHETTALLRADAAIVSV